MTDVLYPFRITFVCPQGLNDSQVFYCKTFTGAWWLIAQYRLANVITYLEEYNDEVQMYVYRNSTQLAEYK